MRTFYTMAAVAVVAIAIALIAVLSRSDTPPGASRDTTSAVAGSARDCGNMTGADKERCQENR